MLESGQKCDMFLENNGRLAEIVYSYLISMPRLLLIAERCPPDIGGSEVFPQPKILNLK